MCDSGMSGPSSGTGVNLITFEVMHLYKIYVICNSGWLLHSGRIQGYMQSADKRNFNFFLEEFRLQLCETKSSILSFHA